jgi:glyoxylase-like metal-dependent hydrolase (beta-lactamase superfamily II)
MNLYTIETGFFKLDGGAMYGVVPKVLWSKINTPDADNLCTWAMRCLLIEDDNRLILVDNGIGDKQDQKFLNHYHLHGNATLESSLAQHGFSKDDITDVILTHLHFDHCGGSIERQGDLLVPAFKNAVYWSNERHWQWAIQPNEREKASFLKENILPIQQSGQLKFIASPEGAFSDTLLTTSFSENISLRFVNGHTESMMLPQVKYKGKTLVYMADLLPSSGHIPLPYIMAYDMFPLITLQEKKAFLKEAVQNDYVLLFEHDPIAECCRLTETEKGIRAGNFFELKEVV